MGINAHVQLFSGYEYIHFKEVVYKADNKYFMIVRFEVYSANNKG